MEREHGETVRERADCGYKVALEKVEKMLDEIERSEKEDWKL